MCELREFLLPSMPYLPRLPRLIAPIAPARLDPNRFSGILPGRLGGASAAAIPLDAATPATPA
jgi:hypothetical protein